MKDTANLVSKYKDRLPEIGSKVVRDFENDWDSLSEYRNLCADIAKLIATIPEKKTEPWDGASNVIAPILATAVIQFHSRTRRSMLPAIRPIRCDSTGKEDLRRAHRVEKYMSFQLYNRMGGWKKEQDLAFLRLPATGTVFKKTYWNDLKKRVESRLLSHNDLVMPYGTLNIEDALRKTHRMLMTENDVNKRIRSGFYELEGGKDVKAMDVLQRTSIDEGISQDASTGISDTRDAEDMPYEMLECHSYWDLNDDGIAEPYIVTVERNSEKVVRIIDNADDNGEPIEWFTPYIFLPNINSGVYGWGLGVLLEDATRVSSTILNQLIDAGHLANVRGGYISKRSGLKKGDVGFKLGEFKEIDVMAGKIGDHIYEFKFSEPSQTLFQLLNLMRDWYPELASVSDITTGQMPPKNTPVGTVELLAEEGRQVFSSVHERVHDAFKEELAKIYRLNGEYMDWDEYLNILGDDEVMAIANMVWQNDPEMQSMISGMSPIMLRDAARSTAKIVVQDDFKGTSDVIPVSDPNITSEREKISRATTILENVKTDPNRANNPQVLWEANNNFLEAIGVEDRDRFNPKPQPEMPDDLPPVEEESRFLKEVNSNVLPEQDHVMHLQSHNIFSGSTWSNELTPQGRKLLDAHVMEHLSELYKQTGGANVGFGQQGGMEGLGGYAPDEGVPEGIGYQEA